MNNTLVSLWQINIEISLLLILVMLARYAVRKTTKVYNAYLLWLSIPVGVLAAQLFSQLNVTKPPVETISYLVHSYVVQPANEVSSWAALAYIWVALSIVLLLRLAVQHVQLRRELRSIEVPTQLIGHSNYPVIGIDKDNFSPAVYGFFQPKIYFPVQLENSLSSEQISLIIQHEEHHISQRHLWLNLVWDILVCSLWFNPLVYIARQKFRHDQELFCDYLVLNKSSQDASRSYGHALLTTVTATHSVSLLCSWKTFNQLEERIMNIKHPSSISSKIALTLAGLVVISATSIYSVSASQTISEQYQHQSSDHSSNEIEWTTESKTFIQKNDKQFLLEEGQQRQLTSSEKELFDAKIAELNRAWLLSEKDHAIEQARLREFEAELGGELDDTPEAEQQLFDYPQEAMLAQDTVRLEHDRLRRESDEVRRKNDEIRRKNDEIRRESDVERLKVDAKRDAVRAQRDSGEQQRDAAKQQRLEAKQQREVAKQQRRMAKQQRDADKQQRREMLIAKREADKDRRIFERAIEIERSKEAHSKEWQEQRDEVLAEIEADKAERISEIAEHRHEQKERHRLTMLEHQEEMAHAEQAIEEARSDIEQSFLNGDIPESHLREIKRNLDRAKRDIERTRDSTSKPSRAQSDAVASHSQYSIARNNVAGSPTLPEPPALFIDAVPTVDAVRSVAPVAPQTEVEVQEQESSAHWLYDYRVSQ